jgi:uncharacterized protein YjbI with pentapeptide repeats
MSAPAKERIEIKHRDTDKAVFTAEIDCKPDAPAPWKLRLAVLVAIKDGADLCWANLWGADLRDAELSGAELSKADLRGANLCRANLFAANLQGAYLSGSEVCGANLSGANLHGTNLREADLRAANLSGSNLNGAELNEADLSDANLSGADLSGADLSDAWLHWTNLGKANLTDAKIGEAYLRGSNFREAKTDFEIATPEQAAPLIQQVAKAALDSGALNMDIWHTSETTHSIAGWAIYLAGEKGKALKEKFGYHIAGLSLLGHWAAGHFYDTDEDATAWLKSKLEN